MLKVSQHENVSNDSPQESDCLIAKGDSLRKTSAQLIAEMIGSVPLFRLRGLGARLVAVKDAIENNHLVDLSTIARIAKESRAKSYRSYMAAILESVQHGQGNAARISVDDALSKIFRTDSMYFRARYEFIERLREKQRFQSPALLTHNAAASGSANGQPAAITQIAGREDTEANTRETRSLPFPDRPNRPSVTDAASTPGTVVAFRKKADEPLCLPWLGLETSSIVLRLANRAYEIGGTHATNTRSLLKLINRLTKASPDAVKRCHDLLDQEFNEAS